MHRSPSARALRRGRGFTLPLLLITAVLLALACHGAIAMSTGGRETWRHRAADDGAAAAAAADGVVAGAAVPDGDSALRFVADPAHPDALAHGAFLDARYTTSNFGKLRIVTGSVHDKRIRRRESSPPSAARGRPHSADRAEAFAGGWLEGWLTAERIYDHFYNLDHYFKTQLNASMPRPMAWLKRNDAWVRQRVARELQQQREQSGDESDNSSSSSPISNLQYWATVDLVVAQADGIAAGYAARSQEAAAKAREAARAAAVAVQSGDSTLAARAAARAAAAEAAAVPPLSADDLLFLNGNGDLYDVIDMYGAIDAGELKPEEDEEDEGEEEEEDDDADKQHHDRHSSTTSHLDRWARRKFHLDDDAAANRTSSDPDPSTAALRLARDLELSGKCSALIKVAADLSDVWLAHSTWDSFTAMTRIYKHLDWSSISESGGLAAGGGGGGGGGGVGGTTGGGKGGPSTGGSLAAPLVSYSGYPGEVASDDDFYLASSGLFVTEATLHLFTAKALEPLRRARGAGVLSWVRVRAATALARDGEQWVEVLGREQSGTYNNAFLVADLKKFVPAPQGAREWPEEEEEVAVAGDATTTAANAKKLPGLYPGFLWLAEQLPGMLPSRDVTDLVALGYVAAYNVPLDEKVYRAAGYPAMVAEAAHLAPADRTYGDPSRLMSYQACPRAQLLRRDQARVASLRDAQRLMRGNAYKSDPLSEGFAVAAVCARGDLISRPGFAEPKGCYDTKVTSWSLAWGRRGGWAPPPLAAEVVGGPTLGGRLWRSGGGGGVGSGDSTCSNVQADKEDPADPADGPLPPFEWDEIRHKDYAHRGMHQGPYTFRFERQQAQEDLPLPGDDLPLPGDAAAVSR